MIDCPNVEMRDRLPDLANETLEPSVRELVLLHLTECAACTAEIEILRTTRLILVTTTPKVNVAGIVSALPQYASVRSGQPQITAPRRGWTTSWRMAAAMTFLAAGIGSYAVLRDSPVKPTIDTLQIASSNADSTVGLALTGALADMSDAELSALAEDIDRIEALPSTEVDLMTSPVQGPTIFPESVGRDMEDR
jgi:hypothetical protein